MYRATIYQRTSLDKPQVADIKILSGSINEDLTQKASSTLIAESVPESVGIGDLLKLYDSRGNFFYWGVISAIKDRELTCSQFQSFYNDNLLLVAQTTTNQKALYTNKTVSYITDFYLKAKELGYQSIANTMSSAYVPAFSSLRDADVADTYKNVIHIIVDEEESHKPYPIDKEVKNLEEYLYDTFNVYNRIIRPFTIINDFDDDIELPSGYTRLTYIENASTAYINTGIKGNNDFKTEVKVNPSALSGHIIGAYNGGVGMYAPYIANSKFYYYYRGTAYAGTNTIAIGNDYIVKTDLTKGAQSMEANGVVERTSTNNNSSSTGVNLILFGYNNAGTINNDFKGKIYYCKIWQNNELVRDYIPCRKESDGKIGMYDLVSNTFYGSGNSANFVAGDDIIKYGIGVALIYPNGTINYDANKTWDYNVKTLFDTWEMISNVEITTKKHENNTVAIYNDTGSTLRGAYTVLNDGTIQEITDGVSVDNRYGVNKTTYVFDASNRVTDLARANLPSIKYNHEIAFDITFLSQYVFSDFSLGMPIVFHSGKDTYSSILTAWKYDIDQTSETVMKAEFTLGKVRKKLTSILNLRR